VLQPSTTLSVQIAAIADGIERARVFVVPRGAVSTEIAQWPFFLLALDDGYAIDANGRAVIGGLPRRGDLGLLVRHPFAPLAEEHEVTLRDEPVQAVVPLRMAEQRGSGVVVDEAGEACAGVAIWSRGSNTALASRPSSRLLPPHLDARGTCFITSGDDGSFTIGLPVGRGALLSLRAAGRAGRDVSWPVDGPLVLPEWRGGEAALEIQPPAIGVAWSVETNLGGGMHEVVAADESWRIALPHAGCFDVAMVVMVGERIAGERVETGVAATGSVVLAAPRVD
jgi:hypothetical protein